MGGFEGYFGYEYQFYASVLIFLLTNANPEDSFKELVIETEFGQDIELTKEHSANEQTLNLHRKNKDFTLQIQVKTKVNKYQWKPGEIKAVLQKKDETKEGSNAETVLNRLVKNPQERFLFVTDGKISPSLAYLLVENINSLERRFPEELNKCSKSLGLSTELAKKIYIIEGWSFESIKIHISNLLLRTYGIPLTLIDKKTKELVDIVRNRALRIGGLSSITIGDLETMLGSRENIPSIETENLFIAPDNFDEARQILDREHIIYIVGEPALGKTTLARKFLNDFHKNNYEVDELSGPDCYRDIFSACLEGSNKILLLDDPFGYDSFDPHLGRAIGNQLNEIKSRLDFSKGRVKVVITSRDDILTQAIQSTKTTYEFIRPSLIIIEFPEKPFIEQILRSHLINKNLSLKLIDEICKTTPLESFENLLHVREFSNNLAKLNFPEINETDIVPVISASNPEIYIQWIDKQTPDIQLFLWVLYWLTEEHISSHQNNEKIFALLQDCFKIPQDNGLLTAFDRSYKFLIGYDRIKENRDNKVEFIHPLLKQATRLFFEAHTRFKSLVECTIDALLLKEHPLELSLSAVLVVLYFDQMINGFDILKSISESRYLLVREKSISRGGHLLTHKDNETREYAKEQIFGRDISPTQCQVDENGDIIFEENSFYSMAELVDAFIIRYSDRFEDDPNLIQTFQNCLDDKNFSSLNPIQRYKFIGWLNSRVEDIDKNTLRELLTTLANDPISFVRDRVAESLGWSSLYKNADLHNILFSLCYDNSPRVKQSALEAGLFRWKEQSRCFQEKLLNVAKDILDDPILRPRIAKGLLDQSGTFYYYHENHSIEEKRQWFKAIVLKLLEYDFQHDDADRFFAAFDEHYEHFNQDYRIELLEGVNSYLGRNPSDAISSVLTIEKIILEGTSSVGERTVIQQIINKVPPIAKSDICFRFAKEYENLTDQRFQEFVHRPFYIERDAEYIFERAAGLLGFLDNPNLDIQMLPEPVRINVENAEKSIQEYILCQTDLFKLITLFHVYGHEQSYLISARYYGLFRYSLIKDLVEYFLTAGFCADSIFIASLVFCEVYSECRNNELDQWIPLVELVLSNNDIPFVKKACDIIFANNVVSNVQYIWDWAILLLKILEHSKEEIRSYAFSLFDQHFYTIWDEISSAQPPKDTEIRKQAYEKWHSGQFIEYIFEFCPNFKEYAYWLVKSKQACNEWNSLSENGRKIFVDELIDSIAESKYYINILAFEFLESMKEQLTEDETQKIISSIFVDEDRHNERFVLGRSAHLEKDFNTTDYKPRFDWSRVLKQ